MQDNNENPQSINPLGVQQDQPQVPHAQEQNVQSAKEKMSKKEKTILRIGIGLIMFTVFVAFISLGLPAILHCIPSIDGGPKPCSNSVAALSLIGSVGLIYLGLPILLIGDAMILYSILSWKKVKDPGLMTLFIMVLFVLLSGLAFIPFVFRFH